MKALKIVNRVIRNAIILSQRLIELSYANMNMIPKYKKNGNFFPKNSVTVEYVEMDSDLFDQKSIITPHQIKRLKESHPHYF